MGEKWEQWQIFFSWTPKSLWMLTAAIKLKDTCSLEEKSVINLDSILKSRYHFAGKGPYSQSCGFPVVMCGCESCTIKKGWARKNWCLWTVVLEKTLESPLDSKEIKPVNPKENQSWILFTGRTDAEASILWPWCKELTHWKRPWCWEGLWGQQEKGMTGWDGWMASPTQWTWVWANSHRREGQESLVC